MRVINKRNLYPIFFLSGILILVLFFSGFSFMEGLTTNTPVVNAVATTTPVVNAATTTTPVVNAPTDTATVPIQVSPATAAIVSSALDSVVQMGVSVIKNSNAAVKQVEATADPSPSPTSGNWTPISSTSTTS